MSVELRNPQNCQRDRLAPRSIRFDSNSPRYVRFDSNAIQYACFVAQMVKSLPAMQETWVRSLDWEDPLEKEMATLSSNLAWKIPWTEEPGRSSPWGHKESDMTEKLHFTFNLVC